MSKTTDQSIESEIADYEAVCPKCRKTTSWLDPREYGDEVGCVHCGYEIMLENIPLTGSESGPSGGSQQQERKG